VLSQSGSWPSDLNVYIGKERNIKAGNSQGKALASTNLEHLPRVQNCGIDLTTRTSDSDRKLGYRKNNRLVHGLVLTNLVP
jgi:hypothetical protein